MSSEKYIPKNKKASYYELLRHPNWQEKRLKVMSRAGFVCEECGEKEITLNVHHTYYEKGLMPWEYPDYSLRCLCEPCHKIAEERRVLLNRQIGRMTNEQMDEVLGFARGLEMEAIPDLEFVAENYEVLEGMVRAFMTLDCRERSRIVSKIIPLVENQRVNGILLCACNDRSQKIAEKLKDLHRKNVFVGLTEAAVELSMEEKHKGSSP